MSEYTFLFDLDSTITKQEILPTIAKQLGVYNQMKELTESTMRGELPFKQSFLQRVDILKDIPVDIVSELISHIELNDLLVEFMRQNRERCYIVTGNLDVWIDKLVKRIGMINNIYCSKALLKNGYIDKVFNVIDKSALTSKVTLPFVAVGDGNNDAEMIEAAEVGIGYGGVRDIAPAVLNCASHAIYDETRLVDFLERLLKR